MKITLYIKCSGNTEKCKCPKCEEYRVYFAGWTGCDYTIYRNLYYGKPETKSRYNKRKRGERPIFLGKK